MCPRTSDPIAVVPVAGQLAPLDYAAPLVPGPRRHLKHAVALAFAGLAIPLGLVFALEALGQCARMGINQCTGDRRTDREAAVGFVECSVITLLPGLYYARLGSRGQTPAALRPVRPGT